MQLINLFSFQLSNTEFDLMNRSNVSDYINDTKK